MSNDSPIHEFVEFSLNIDSNPSNGAINVSADGSVFCILIEESLKIPLNARNLGLAVHEASIWNSIHNISAALGNNTFRVSEAGVVFTSIIPDGNYSIEELQDRLQIEHLAVGGIANTFLLEGDSATQRTSLTLDATLIGAPGVSVDFLTAGSPRILLGFDAVVVGPVAAAASPAEFLSDNIATFNALEYFSIKSDISEGINENGTYKNTLARVYITQPAGSQIVYQPFSPSKVNINNLIGASRHQFQFRLTDQNGNPLEVQDFWSARLVFSYNT